MKRISILVCACAALAAIACHAGGKNDLSALLDELDGGTAPVMEALVITAADSGSITLAAPTFSEEGSPAPELRAYIGVNGTVHCAGSLVTGSTEGPVDQSGEEYRFSGLSAGTTYRIIVTARNIAGTSVREIIQSTAGIAPVLGELAVSGSDESSITLERPAFSTAGNPMPEVRAYIGHDGVILSSGLLVKNYIEGPVDVSSYGFRFTELVPSRYRIIVVAENSAGYSVAQIIQGTAPVAPALNGLSLSGSDAGSIALDRPALATAGYPAPSVEAYIGTRGVISVNGATVSDFLQGPVDVSAGGCLFAGLEPDTEYRVIVVAENTAGYSVKQINRSVPCAAPVLAELAVSGSDGSSITLERPAFAAAGCPAPSVEAYIGKTGVMSEAGGVVSGFLHGPADVSLGGYRFAGLEANTGYTIMVAARNITGFSVKEIVQSTDAVAPVLNDLAIGSADESSIELTRPTFEVAGNPQPLVEAYIGYAGDIAVSGGIVSNYSGGPADVSIGGCQFGGLDAGTGYEIIVVARNARGFSVKSIMQGTDCDAPVLNDLEIEAVDASSITLARPGFAAAGNPLPAVSAYIGPDGGISVTDGVVSGHCQGPADASLGGCRFDGLSAGGQYRVIVVARNAGGYSVKETICEIPAVNLYFTEYIEGSSNNKALEIYNAGGCAVPLLGHVTVVMFANGSPGPYATCQCAGQLAPGAVYVVAHPRAVAAVAGQADALDDVCGFNGNDAIVLSYDGVPLDAIGQAGFNPGTDWSDGGISTMNRTLRRKSWVTKGDADPWDAFVLSNEWDGYSLDAFDDLGMYVR